MRIIPAIDLIDGACVRLSKGDYDTKVEYYKDPLDAAKYFEGYGIKYLHLVDLDGAKSGKVVNYKVLERITSKTSLSVDFGGGVKSDQDLDIVFSSGAKQVTGGSIAVQKPDVFLRWLENFGADRIILGADALDEKIAVSGWLENSAIPLIPFVMDYLQKGVKTVVCTDISKDGMLCGPSTKLYERLINSAGQIHQSIDLVASGGMSTMDDLYAIHAIGCSGAIIGKALYEGKISMDELSKFSSENHVE
jgi:phosphoribosylformimino-5-aminoimidazole carboxamide ribotide isomerase